MLNTYDDEGDSVDVATGDEPSFIIRTFFTRPKQLCIWNTSLKKSRRLTGRVKSPDHTGTDELVKVSIFVSVLPSSGYAYVEGFLLQNQENWISPCKCVQFFGGVTRILVSDNL